MKKNVVILKIVEFEMEEHRKNIGYRRKIWHATICENIKSKFIFMYTFFSGTMLNRISLELTELTLWNRTWGQNRGGRRGRFILHFKPLYRVKKVLSHIHELLKKIFKTVKCATPSPSELVTEYYFKSRI